MKILCNYYEDEYIEVKKEDDEKEYIVKDKESKKYYSLPEQEFRKLGICCRYIEKEHSFLLFAIYFLLFLILSFFNLFILKKHVYQVDLNIYLFSMFIYMPIFIICHELGHFFSLRFFGRREDKIGFKFNYIFPSFYVRMNDSYMLDKIEKIYVHSMGLFISLIMNNLIYVIGYLFNNLILIDISIYFSFDIMLNTLPLLNSDGYKIMFTIFGWREKKNKSENSLYVKMMNIINWSIVIIYSIFFIIKLL